MDVGLVNVDPIPPAPHPAEIDELRRALEQAAEAMRIMLTGGPLGDGSFISPEAVRQRIDECERLLNAQ